MSTIDEIRRGRLEKLQKLVDSGMEVYPVASRQDYTLAQAVEKYGSLAKQKKPIYLVGRIMSLRPQGAIAFFTLDDGTGRFQGFMKRDEGIDGAMFDLFIQTIDVGDFVEVGGKLFETQRGEKTLNVAIWRILAKSLRPLPEKWHGLQDVEERFRKRYLDVIASGEVKERFIIRSKIITEIRRFFDRLGFLEVETPILQPLAGGASAEPFVTHHRALDIDMHLRIAPELYLKELLIAGFPKVYEIGRLFRNEGIDATHNPEFTTIEFYESYAQAKNHRVLVEKVIKSVVKKIFNRSVVEFDGHQIDFSKKFEVITFMDLLKRFALIPNPETITFEEAKIKAQQLGVKVEVGDPIHKVLDNIYKKACRPKLIQPTYIIDYPTAFSPLAKHKEGTDEFIDRFQLVVGGYELVNAFSELNDPIEQKKRFLLQEKNKKLGDREAQPNDEEYVEAMEYGMPPAGGVAISIDRLTMLLTNTKNIREVILFPTLRPNKSQDRS